MLWRSHARPPRTIQICRSKGLLQIIFFSLIKHKLFSTNTIFSDFWCADCRSIKPILNFVEVQNHNQILQFEVYAHSDGHSMPQDAIIEQRVTRAIFVSFIVENRWCG